MSVLPALAVIKPTGIFSASGSGGDDVTGIYQKDYLRGVLIRVPWSAIKPTLTGAYSWTSLDSAIDNAKLYNRSYSLAVVAGGVGSPAWLTNSTSQGGAGAPYFEYSFQTQTNIRLPLFWNSIVQTQLQQLAAALAARYGGDPDLKLVYITQMTTNGIEGHLNGIDMGSFSSGPDGYTDAKWIAAAEQTARSFANAFTGKALAFEVHDVNGGSSVPSTIINQLWDDPALGERVGAAMWWLSGRETEYQADLLAVLAAYPGDIYAQVISPSSDGTYLTNGYPAVYTQAKSLGVRYIEPWENEFKNGTNNANGQWDATFVDYNSWADATFGGSGGGTPVTVNFAPTDDAYVYQGTPNGTNGTTTTIQLASTTQDRFGFLKFAVSGISGTVTNATLKLKCSVSQTGSTRVYPVSNTTWTEGTLTWNNRPAMGAQTDSKTNVAAGQVISLDVTSLVTGNATKSFGLQTTSASTLQYYSKERTGTADDPVLQVTYIP